MSGYGEFFKIIIKKSEADNWNEAVLEWDKEDLEIDSTNNESCICGKENLVYLFTIKNKLNGNEIFPIGSSCIKKFERDDLTKEVETSIQFFQLLEKVNSKSYIALSSDIFSRKLLKELYDKGVFKPNEFNKSDGENDYKFLLKMFNQRKDPTPSQQRKINGLVAYTIKPYLEEIFKDKVK